MQDAVILAEQLVYARVEPALSPRRVAGFQTVFHSPSLTPLKDEIQRLVGDFHYDGTPQEAADHVERLQYCQLSDGRVLLSRTVPAWHTEYLDASGRPGTFLCHCLVLASDQFLRAQNHPFVVFEAFYDQFLNTAEELYERFVQEPPADHGRVSIPIMQMPVPDSDWPPELLRELRKAAILAKSTVARGGSVAFVGDRDETTELLQVIFGITPKLELRRHCTFNTCADGSTVPPRQFWALGFAKRPRQKHVGEIDVQEKRILRLPQSETDQVNSHFAVWLDKAITDLPCSEVLEQAATVEWLAETMQGQCALTTPPSLHRKALESFVDMFRTPLAERLIQPLSPWIGEGLAPELAKWLIDHRLTSDDMALAVLQPERWKSQDIAEWAFWYIVSLFDRQDGEHLTRQDWRQLRKLARRSKAGKLLFLSAVADPWPLVAWKRERVRKQALAWLDEAQFDELFEVLKMEFEPIDFVAAGKVQWIARKLEKRRFSARDLYRLLRAMLAQREPFIVPEQLCRQVQYLTPSNALALWQMCDSRYPSDQRLREAIDDRALDARPSSGWLRWWRQHLSSKNPQ
jgi:hypothetical protein